VDIHSAISASAEFFRSLVGRCFSTTAEFWMNLQQRYELEAARREVGVAVER
jgi:plasmid maintenance system antidote protein VapI